ncbi:uncharacterized protein LOC135937620 [Cloeon dipterum]|uniref:uncharacterized protein LOC135937620 n=1 Tax=Cloeon dipterum TaxID=197152 RepID=UPI00321FE3EE
MARQYISEQLEAGNTIGNITIAFKQPGRDRITLRDKTHALPVCETEVAALFDTGGVPEGIQAFVVKNGFKQKVHPADPNRNLLLYPVLYPHGIWAWYPGGHEHQGPNRTAVRNRVTLHEHLRLLCFRREPPQIELNCGPLTQQYHVDQWTRVQENVLNFLRHTMPHEMKLDSMKHMQEMLQKVAENMHHKVGRSFLLPKNHHYGDESMQQLYQHAIVSIKKTGMPNFFVTITANPREPEVNDIDGVDFNDGSLNSDLKCRAIAAKVERVKDMFLVNPDDDDSFVSTGIADPAVDKKLHDCVKKFMLHNCTPLCAAGDNRAVCKKGFPVEQRDNTTLNDGKGFIRLKRPPGGRTVRVRGRVYSNRDVVPYNPYLLKTLNCHVNVVPFNSLRQIRYVCKYITKGPDMATTEMTAQRVGHTIRVLDLNVHTPEQTPVVWLARTGQEGAIAAADRPLKKSKFLAYFDLYRTANDVDRILLERIKFVDVPEFFT